MHSRPLILRNALLSLAFVTLFLALNRPEVIFLSQLGFAAWYPATGLGLALMLGVSPWYGLVVCVSDALAGAIIYHQPLKSVGETAGAVGITICYVVAAYLLRGPLHIDVSLGRRRDVVRYVVVTTVAAMAATVIGVCALVADGTIRWSQFWSSAIAWFFGDAIALLSVAPFLLIHVVPRVKSWLGIADYPQPEAAGANSVISDVGHVLEALSQFGALLAILWVMFGPMFGARQLFYLSYIPVIWMAMRQGVRRVVSGLLVLNFGIVVALHIFAATPGALAKVGLLMLVVSGVGLIAGSAVSERHRISSELQAQTIYLNSLIENSPLGIAVFDQQGRVELTNAAFEKLFLYDHRELAGSDLDLVLSPEDEPMKSLGITKRVFAGQPVQATVRRRRRDGKILDLEVHAVPLSVNGRVQGAFSIYKDISEQIKASEAERKHAESLSRLVQELQLRTDQMTLLNEMGDLLECSGTSKEACSVVSQSVPKLFPEALSGTLYLFRSSRNLVEVAARWGNSNISDPMFPPEACWALRRGQSQWSGSAEEIRCPHLSPEAVAECLCVPMVGQEGTLGVLHLEFSGGNEIRSEFNTDDMRESRQQLAETVAGQIAFSLTSLRLRETLRDQSIRDPLTALFNRRFMEESLARELQRAGRKHHSVAILFLDLDEFKHFNDNYGHDAGDLVLRSVADLFRRFFRADDVCCRYGGEEFAIILPESTADYAAIRANALREEVKKLDLHHKNHVLGTVSVSIGIAAFPDHGSTSEELLKAADRCLYDSKAAGRDTVTVAAPQQV